MRFDGDHRHDPLVADLLGQSVEWVPVCPEVESGMPIPRPTLRLADLGAGVRMVESAAGVDHTRAMKTYSVRRVRELQALDLSGYVLKMNSPSCGMARVKIHDSKGTEISHGAGLFASVLMEACPQLPIEEEGRLHDAKLRENFVERVLAYQNLRESESR